MNNCPRCDCDYAHSLGVRKYRGGGTKIHPLCGTDPEPKIWAASPVENTPWEPNQAVRSIPRGHGTEGLPPSWSLHRVMASLWSPRVQVRPFRVLHGSEPWALAGWRRGPHGRLRAVPSSNCNPRTAGPASGARAARNKLPREDVFVRFLGSITVNCRSRDKVSGCGERFVGLAYVIGQILTCYLLRADQRPPQEACTTASLAVTSSRKGPTFGW